MSAICLINPKSHKLKFEELNEMAKKIIRYTLDNNMAAFFNSHDYDSGLIKAVKVENFFLLSDSFIYQNADDLLDTISIRRRSMKTFKKDFLDKFHFFTDILEIIFSFKITEVDIYVSEGGDSGDVEDFDLIQTNQHDFLNDLHDCIIKYADEWAYCFPPLKFEVRT